MYSPVAVTSSMPRWKTRQQSARSGSSSRARRRSVLLDQKSVSSLLSKTLLRQQQRRKGACKYHSCITAAARSPTLPRITSQFRVNQDSYCYPCPRTSL